MRDELRRERLDAVGELHEPLFDAAHSLFVLRETPIDALEAFDAIGRHRATDLGGRPVDTQVTAPDGTELEGFEGLRTYLLTVRREAFVRQFCRKLLGYALGRAVQLSDEPLLAEMQGALAANDYKVDVAVEAIVLSRQFREIRGIELRGEE